MTYAVLKMAASEDICSSCFNNTKYKCLLCGLPFCMKCSVFENDEDVPGWAAGKAVAYCEVCFEEKMKKEEVKDSQSSRSMLHEQFNSSPVSPGKSMIR